MRNQVETKKVQCQECGHTWSDNRAGAVSDRAMDWGMCPSCANIVTLNILGPGQPIYLVNDMEYLGCFQSGDLVVRIKAIWPGAYDYTGRYWGTRTHRPQYWAFFYERQPDGTLKRLGALTDFRAPEAQHGEFRSGEEAARAAILWATAYGDIDENNPSDMRWKALVELVADNVYIEWDDNNYEPVVHRWSDDGKTESEET